MNQTQGANSSQPATGRAEELMNRLGRRLGNLATSTSQRIQSATTHIREEADRMDEPTSNAKRKSNQPTQASTEEAAQPPMEKAEEMVDRMSQRVQHFTALVGLRLQKATARMREEAEDMWAEAQDIRQKNYRKRQ